MSKYFAQYFCVNTVYGIRRDAQVHKLKILKGAGNQLQRNEHQCTNNE